MEYDPYNPAEGYHGSTNTVYTVDELMAICKQCVMQVCTQNSKQCATLSEIYRHFPFMRSEWSTRGCISIRLDKQLISILMEHLEKTGGALQKKTSKLNK